MIIAKSTAMKLVSSGSAEITGHVWDDGRRYAVVTRYDLQRTDHFIAPE